MSADTRAFPTVVDPPFDYPEYVGTRLRAPKEPLVVVPHLLSELTGPVYGDGAIDELDSDLTRQHVGHPLGERIVVSGRVLGNDGGPLRGQLVEIWQANAAGRYRLRGFGRSGTVDRGRFAFVTVKPGRVPWAEGGLQAPHLLVGVFARRLLQRVATRMYFPDEVEANGEDPVLSRLETEARATLVAVPEADGSLRVDIRLQGDGHTMFFAV